MESENIAEAPSVEAYPMCGVYRDELLKNEAYLSGEIIQLWEVHRCYSTDIKAEQFRQRALGNTLGQLLHAVKRILVSPGRMGRWSGWLKERKISRATADRMVNRYSEAFNLLGESAHESTPPEPTEIQINKLLADVWPRLEKALTTERSRYEFMRCYLYRSGLNYDWRDDGIMIFEPGHRPQEPEVIASEPQTATGDGEYGDVL